MPMMFRENKSGQHFSFTAVVYRLQITRTETFIEWLYLVFQRFLVTTRDMEMV